MMRKNVAFYISEHGYGHAVRTLEVVRLLANQNGVDTIYVRTAAPRSVLTDVDHPPVHLCSLETGRLDNGAKEDHSPLVINPRRTLDAVALLLQNREQIVDDEADFIRQKQVALVVADIPFLAGDIAYRAGVPRFALGNFTWDWIYEAYLSEFPQFASDLQTIRHSYQLMTRWLRLSFHHDSDLFGNIVDLPLIARKSTMASALPSEMPYFSKRIEIRDIICTRFKIYVRWQSNVVN